jgi:hypothetical protein
MQVETPSPSIDMVVDVIQDQKHSYERYIYFICLNNLINYISLLIFYNQRFNRRRFIATL